MANIKTLIASLKKAKKELVFEFEAEGLDFDDDTITSVELSLEEIEVLLKALDLYSEEEEDYEEEDEDDEDDFEDFDIDDEDEED